METQTQMGNLIQMQIQEVRPFQHATKEYSVCFTGSSLRSPGRKARSATGPGLTAYHHAGSAHPFLTTSAGTD
jgi:hypothetical protein